MCACYQYWPRRSPASKIMVLIDTTGSDVSKLVRTEGMDVCVVSYGGSCSNTLADVLTKNGVKCRTRLWDLMLCHCKEALSLDIPTIYIFDEPKKSFLSMKRRSGLLNTNFRKLSNGAGDTPFSEEAMLGLMFEQFRNWSAAAQKDPSKVLMVRSKELFESAIVDRLASFLNKPRESLVELPVKYRAPATKLDTMSESHRKLFTRFEDEIARVNTYATNSP
jgi:hypothetical protein